ncbi:hypothetical protein V2I01_06285 [Micromonospora sp. BRA006-A]|nr:hypothetical protein [Micromonospora sp. BRA006-A]
MSTSEACRLVGINRRTGHRWRYGRTSQMKAGQQGVPPAARPLPCRTGFCPRPSGS